MANKKGYEIDMCEGAILPKMLQFTIPLMLSSILQLMFNAADVVVVGRFAGDNSLAAVGCTGSLINLLTNLFVGLSVGTNVMAARHYGAKQRSELHATVHTSIMIAICGGILLMFVGVTFTKGILEIMGTPEPVLPLAALYLRIYFLGMVSNMLYNFGSALLRAVGDTRRPMYYLMIAGVINVILNLIFVIIFKMDVAGVALATIISQTVSALLVLKCLITSDSDIKLVLKELGIDARELKNIIRIGIPAGLQGCIFSLSNVVIQSSINSFGEIVVSGSSACSNLEGFVYVAMNSFYQAALAFISQNMGAGKYERIRKIMLCAIFSVMFTGFALGRLELAFGRRLLGIYTTNPAVIEAGMARMQIIDSTYFLCGLMDVMVGVLRGIGYSVMPMIVSLVGACGTRLLWIATVFQIDRYHKVETVYISYTFSWFLTFAAHFICFLIVRKKAVPEENKAYMKA
ncbi:MAG: MATE family efflux transporter [Lachnospiraceae bacterium]|nr:MATE family efflux transporter [Lachnospiraceae bacterium]